MTDAAPDPLRLLPLRLREARQRLGLSLDGLARLSGVSRSMVSQIERGESSPTVATLWNLTRALNVDFAGLLDGAGDPGGIDLVRADAAPTIAGHGINCRIRILSAPEQAGRHEVYDLVFAPGGRLDSDPHSAGCRELLTVISGRLRLRAGAAETLLAPGDTARYPADQPHAIAAEGEGARAILVVDSP